MFKTLVRYLLIHGRVLTVWSLPSLKVGPICSYINIQTDPNTHGFEVRYLVECFYKDFGRGRRVKGVKYFSIHTPPTTEKYPKINSQRQNSGQCSDEIFHLVKEFYKGCSHCKTNFFFHENQIASLISMKNGHFSRFFIKLLTLGPILFFWRYKIISSFIFTFGQ